MTQLQDILDRYKGEPHELFLTLGRLLPIYKVSKKCDSMTATTALTLKRICSKMSAAIESCNPLHKDAALLNVYFAGVTKEARYLVMIVWYLFAMIMSKEATNF